MALPAPVACTASTLLRNVGRIGIVGPTPSLDRGGAPFSLVAVSKNSPAGFLLLKKAVVDAVCCHESDLQHTWSRSASKPAAPQHQMSDPLSIAAGVVGILTAAAQISTLLIQFTQSSRDASVQARHVLTEVNDISGILSHLQTFLIGQEYVESSRTSMLRVDHIVAIVSGCVMTFSELEKVLDGLKTADLGAIDSIRWARKDTEIMTIIQRLQNHKASLSLMLNILNGYVHQLRLFLISTNVAQHNPCRS